jgi:hypothetical protein
MNTRTADRLAECSLVGRHRPAHELIERAPGGIAPRITVLGDGVIVYCAVVVFDVEHLPARAVADSVALLEAVVPNSVDCDAGLLRVVLTVWAPSASVAAYRALDVLLDAAPNATLRFMYAQVGTADEQQPRLVLISPDYVDPRA